MSIANVLNGLSDLITELEAIYDNIESADMLTEHDREELEGQSGTINTLLEEWK